MLVGLAGCAAVPFEQAKVAEVFTQFGLTAGSYGQGGCDGVTRLVLAFTAEGSGIHIEPGGGAQPDFGPYPISARQVSPTVLRVRVEDELYVDQSNLPNRIMTIRKTDRGFRFARRRGEAPIEWVRCA